MNRCVYQKDLEVTFVSILDVSVGVVFEKHLVLLHLMDFILSLPGRSSNSISACFFLKFLLTFPSPNFDSPLHMLINEIL